MVASHQIVIMIPMFDVEMPANAQSVFGVLLKIAAFDMIPVEVLYEDMLEELESLENGFLDKLKIKMDGLGFDSIWILPNLGSL